MKVIVYLEGISDKKVLETLFAELIEEKRIKGIYITFHEAPEGNKKASVLNKVPVRAADHLVHNPASIVIAIPDLYPKNVGFPHNNLEDIREGIIKNTRARLLAKRTKDPDFILQRLKIFCFKHDMEVLLLAVPEKIKTHLGMSNFKTKWDETVEEQNNDRPPKYVIEELFQESGKKYREKLDSLAILDGVHYDTLASRCPESFKPFVEFLKSL
jgi:hypothetical protein